MVGLEKTKAAAGEISQSARALTLEDMHSLYLHCLVKPISSAEKRAGILRLVSFVLYVFSGKFVYLQFTDNLPICMAPPASN
jgi:hypothetical protein